MIINTFYIMTCIVLAIMILSTAILARNLPAIVSICSLGFVALVIWTFSFNVLSGYSRNLETFDSSFYFFEDRKFIVKDFYLVTGERIDLWLINRNNITMSFSVPWDEKLAQRLHEGKELERKEGAQMELEFSDDAKKQGVGDGEGDGEKKEGADGASDSEGDPAEGQGGQAADGGESGRINEKFLLKTVRKKYIEKSPIE